jgi:hypothetical protein
VLRQLLASYVQVSSGPSITLELKQDFERFSALTHAVKIIPLPAKEFFQGGRGAR